MPASKPRIRSSTSVRAVSITTGSVAAPAADRLADGVAAHAGQHQVEHDEVDRRRRPRQQVERRLPVAGGRHREAFGLEVELDAEGEVLFVLDDEDVGHAAALGGGPPSDRTPATGPRGYDAGMTQTPRRPRNVSQPIMPPAAPPDIGRPQRAFVEAAAGIGGRVLDSGCGTGDLAIWLAETGHTVTGVDFLEPPLAAARRKAADRSVAVTFLRMDARDIGSIPERFDAVTDCGLFHTFDDPGREAYVRALAALLEPGARLFVLCFATDEPGTHGPRRVAEHDLRARVSRRLDRRVDRAVAVRGGARDRRSGVHIRRRLRRFATVRRA